MLQNEGKKSKDTNDAPPVEQEEPKAPQLEKPKMRKIIIETDGNQASIITAEVAGNLELKAILVGLVESFDKQK